MDWFNQLLGVETPAGTTLRSAELGFRADVTWWLAGLAVIAIAAGVLLLYAKESGRLHVARRALLAGLRISVLVLLLLLLFRPVLLAEFAGERAQPIVLLVDNSESMTQRDRRLSAADWLRVAIAQGRVAPDAFSASLTNVPDQTPKEPSRLELVTAVLTNGQLKLADSLRAHGPLRPLLFGQEIQGALNESADDSKAALDPLLENLKGRESRTALADAISVLLQRKHGDLPAAIVVMSDGQDNASRLTLEDAARDCARLEVPLHIYGVGSSEAGSLQIKDITIPDTIFHGDAIEVPLRWRAQGFKKGTVVMTLTLGKKVVAEREVPVRQGEDLRETLTFTPAKGTEREQKLDLVASIRLKGNDKFQDALPPRPVRLIDSKVKILYVEYAPRWEYKFLVPMLRRDHRVETKLLLVSADAEALRPPAKLSPDELAQWPYLQKFPATREELFSKDKGFDLIILGDVPKDYLGQKHLEWIREFVEDKRGGLVMIAGRQHAPASYLNSPLAEVLPVEFLPVKFPVEADVRTLPSQAILTDVGLRAPMLALADTPDENRKVWQSLPGFHWHYPVTKLRPGAAALVVHPTVKMGEQPMPIVASQYFGKGQVLFLGTDETWRWRYNAQDKHFARFWGQLIYQMGLPHLLGDNSQRVQLALERSEALLGRPGLLYARLLDKEFQPIKDKSVKATLHWWLDAKPDQENQRDITLELAPGRDGEYRALLPHDQAGRYEVRLRAPEKTTFHYRVHRPAGHEMEERGMAEESLRRAARLSGGHFYQEEDLYRLAGQVTPRKHAFTLRQEVLLWNPLIFLLLVGLVTAEWVLRKFANLS